MDATHLYLWRFWRRLKPPDEKQILVFDRSWYGRPLVERVEGFCTEEKWKLTEEDWRNREKWDQYEAAVDEMLLKTATVTAPWTIVEGNDKWYARVKALRTLAEVLSQRLDCQPSEPAAKEAKKQD